MDLENERIMDLENERSWADLPEELLEIISLNLFAKDLHNFSQVCESWYEAVEDSPYRRSPCLMTYDKSSGMWKFYQYNRSFFMSIPELDSAYICSSNYGWLLMSRENGTLFFFDPFNRRGAIEVPGTGDGDYTSIHFFEPPTSQECFIIGIKNVAGSDGELVKIGMLRRGKESWESWICRSSDAFTVTLSAPVEHEGLLYFVDEKGNVATVDVERVESSWTVHSKCIGEEEEEGVGGGIRQHFLVEMAVDHLGEDDDEDERAVHAVFMSGEGEDEEVKVYKLSGKMEWEGVSFLGRRAMYLSQGCSIGCRPHFNYMVDTLFFPKFMEDGDEIVKYCSGCRHPIYRSYSIFNRLFPHSRFSHGSSRTHFYSSYGLRGLDFGVTWILPSSPTHLHLPTW